VTGEALVSDRPYKVVARCPACGQYELVRIAIGTRLERTRSGAVIGLKVKAEKVDHDCGQLQVDGFAPAADAYGTEPMDLDGDGS
jgi:hypothetical protein